MHEVHALGFGIRGVYEREDAEDAHQQRHQDVVHHFRHPLHIHWLFGFLGVAEKIVCKMDVGDNRYENQRKQHPVVVLEPLVLFLRHEAIVRKLALDKDCLAAELALELQLRDQSSCRVLENSEDHGGAGEGVDELFGVQEDSVPHQHWVIGDGVEEVSVAVAAAQRVQAPPKVLPRVRPALARDEGLGVEVGADGGGAVRCLCQHQLCGDDGCGELVVAQGSRLARLKHYGRRHQDQLVVKRLRGLGLGPERLSALRAKDLLHLDLAPVVLLLYLGGRERFSADFDGRDQHLSSKLDALEESSAGKGVLADESAARQRDTVERRAHAVVAGLVQPLHMHIKEGPAARVVDERRGPHRGAGAPDSAAGVIVVGVHVHPRLERRLDLVPVAKQERRSERRKETDCEPKVVGHP
mmetsp:Transcript_58464/g.137276  ORF Transcript_58464/g.137276 Transcript_58464/m.137276 type:complete len:412 (-) Transcript_58464:3035-4270(-)